MRHLTKFAALAGTAAVISTVGVVSTAGSASADCCSQRYVFHVYGRSSAIVTLVVNDASVNGGAHNQSLPYRDSWRLGHSAAVASRSSVGHSGGVVRCSITRDGVVIDRDKGYNAVCFAR